MEILQSVSNMFLNSVNHASVSSSNGNMKKYEQAYKSGEHLMLSFERVDSITGDLSLVDEDITVVMPAEQISGKAYDLKYRAQKLEQVYCVKVVGIDIVNKLVHVSHHAARLEMRPKIENELNKCLSAKDKAPILVKGKVLKIQTKTVDGVTMDTGVWLDLCGVGIPAYIYIGNWKKTFTESLRGKARYGDIVDVIVTEKVERNKGMYYYACSRKELVQDPWESLKLNEKYHKGDIVKIRCISKKENHWFGEINGLEDIQVFAEYPSSKHDFMIVPGMEYMGTIYYINTEERSLKARVFQALSFAQLEEENMSAEENDVEDSFIPEGLPEEE